MATQFQEIYDMFLNETMDTDLAMLPTDLFYERLWNFLRVGIGEFSRRCYKDLSKRISYQHKNYQYYSDIDGNKSYILSDLYNEGIVFVSVNNVITSNFSYDFITNQITINNVKKDDLIYIGNYIIGQFESDLNDTEQEILVKAMHFSYGNYKSYQAKLLNMQIFGKDFKLSGSPANQLKEVYGLTKSQKEMLERDIVQYTYYHADDSLIGKMGG